MVDYQWHQRVKKGKPVEAIHFEKQMELLTERQKVGLIGRKGNVDFEGTPGWYRSVFRGLLYPFITGTHKGAQQFASLITKMPFKRPLRFLGLVAAPLAAIHLWNNTGWRKKVRDRLGWAGGRWYTTILKGFDHDENGDPRSVLVWSPRTNLDEAGEWIGMDRLLQRMRRLRRREETGTLRQHHLDDFVTQTLRDTGFGPVNKLDELKNPVLQFREGWKTNRDPFTRKEVMPPEVKGTPAEMRYLRDYFIKKMLSPIEQLARAQKGGTIEQKGPARWPALWRSLAGTASRQFSVPRAFGFRMIDLDRIEASEQRYERNSLVAARRAAMRRVQEAFAYGRDLRVPDSVFAFHDEVVEQYEKIAQNQVATTEVGRVLEDALERGVDLGKEVYGSPRQQGSIANMILHPNTWAMKLTAAHNEGAGVSLPMTPTMFKEPRQYTKAEKEELTQMIKTLEQLSLTEDLGDAPFAVREELIKQVLGVYGVNVPELMEQLETR
jgi:hypothetical protein